MTISPATETSQKPEPSPACPWSVFDRVYCISVKDRADRRDKARQEFQRLGLIDRVEFLLVERHPTNSEQGIFESHMACLRAALAAGAQKILIFEDDVLFDHFSPAVLARAAQFIKSNTDWRLFFFGCFVKSSRKTNFPSILRIRYSCAAHAYAVNQEFAKKLVEQPWRGIAYDDFLRSLNDEHFYTCYPSFAFQSGSATDNYKMRTVDRIRRLFGGSRLLQRWNEFSHHNLRALIVVHFFILLLLIFIVLVHEHLL